jgi:tetratricopeptide (TPR) repeat protein
MAIHCTCKLTQVGLSEYWADCMDIHNPVIALCIQGTQAEFRGETQHACALYQKAWDIAGNDYEACIAAHYMARHQDSPEAALRWNTEALRRAEAESASSVDASSVTEFYPSLYLNMGQSYERLGNQAEAQRFYDLAAALGFPHQDS